jgi:uncharacterized GH25 family protein
MFRLLAAPLLCLVLLAPVLWSAAGTRAHEYWLDARQPLADAQARLTADARVGQFFIGEALPWLEETVARLGVADARGVRDISRLPGDMPMIDAAPRTAGAHILFVQTRPETLTWETAEKFIAFLREKRLERILAAHRRRGLPDAGFREHYIRYAKALLWRGARPVRPEVRADRPLGLRLELVALNTPYALPARAATVRVQLLWEGKPLAGADAQLFCRPHAKRDEPAKPAHFTTDAQGIVALPLRAGLDCLVNAVHMTPAAPGSDAAWVSHWASLTFTTATSLAAPKPPRTR